MATTTLLIQENYLASRASGEQKIRLRYNNPATSAHELNFAKAAGASNFGTASEAAFVMDPAVDGAENDTAVFKFKKGEVEKTFYSVVAGTDKLQAANLIVTNATMDVLRVSQLFATQLTVVNQTNSVDLYVTSDKVVADELQVTGAVTVGSLNILGNSSLAGGLSANSLNITSTSVFGGALTANSTMNVSGAATLQSSLNVAGAAVVQSTLTANDLKVTNTLAVGGAAALGAGLTVTGATTIVGDENVSGALVVNTLKTTGTAAVGTTLVVGQTATAANLEIVTNAHVGSNLTVDAKATVGSDLLVSGAASIVGALNAASAVTAGSLYVSSTMEVNNAASLKATLSVSGNATFSSNVDINALTAQTVAIQNSLLVTGDSTFLGSFAMNSLKVTTTADIGGNVTAGANVAVKGNTVMDGTLTVSGAAVMSNTVQIAGAASLGSSLGVVGAATVTGATVLLGGLSVTGGSTLSATPAGAVATIKNNAGSTVASIGVSSDFNATGPVSVLMVTGDMIMKDTLNVRGDLYANGDLFVTQSLTVNGDANISGPIYATGTMHSMYVKDGENTRSLIEVDQTQFQNIVWTPDQSNIAAGILGYQYGALQVLGATSIGIVNGGGASIQLNYEQPTTISGGGQWGGVQIDRLIVQGTSDMQGKVFAAAGLQVSQGADVYGPLNAMNDLTVYGAMNMNALAVQGLATFYNNVWMNQTLRVSGASTLASAVVTGAATCGSLRVTGATTLAAATVSTLTATATATVANLFVSGVANIKGGLTATGSNNVYGSLSVSANGANPAVATINGDLIADTLTVSQASTLIGPVTASSGIVVSSGGATITGPVVVNDGSTFYGTVDVMNTFTVSQTATINELNVTGTVNASAFATTSDARLKKDITEIEGALAKVQALRPVEYNWNETSTMNPEHKEVGFIAQEVEAVVPGVVVTAGDEMATKRVAYDRLTALLVGAVKEQAAVIAALEARLAALEARA